MTMLNPILIFLLFTGPASSLVTNTRESKFTIKETDEEINIHTSLLEATIRKSGYVSGIAGKSFLDKTTGFRDSGFGLDIVDWIMEPGSDESYRQILEKNSDTRELIYRFGIPEHGQRAKRCIEGPQICTKAKKLKPTLVRGTDFVAVHQQYQYQTAAPGKNAGSLWTQWIVFPEGKRYFISMDQVDSVNSSHALFQRIDMPGHILHQKGNSFSKIYLSYLNITNDSGGFSNGIIPASAFATNFAPDVRFNYRRDRGTIPKRFIRAYRLRNTQTSKDGPWLAGMTLDPAIVHEAWCHQRNYVCMIQEFGGHPIKAGESFRAAFIVGFFDSIDEMHTVYDQHAGHTGLSVTHNSWQLTK